MTGLSAQTVSVIMRHLEADRLLRRGEPQRGRVGQPLGAAVARSRGRLFRRREDRPAQPRRGAGRFRRRHPPRAAPGYPYPTPATTIAPDHRRGRAPARRCSATAPSGSPASASPCPSRSGTGPRRSARRRRRWTPGAASTSAPSSPRRLPYPVYLQNDATAACGAELAFGEHAGLQDFIYFYVGAFVGGGLVLNGGLFTGRTGNAAALGSMPVPDGAGGTEQLIDLASLVLLERRLRAAGLPRRRRSTTRPATGSGFGGAARRAGSTAAARGIAHAIAAAARDDRLRGGGDRRRLPAPVRRGWSPPSAPSSRGSTSRASHPPACAPAASGRSPARSAAPACRSSTATSSTSTIASKAPPGCRRRVRPRLPGWRR